MGDWLQRLYDLYGASYDYPYTDYQQVNLDFVFGALVEQHDNIAELQESLEAVQSEVAEVQGEVSEVQGDITALQEDLIKAKFRLVASVDLPTNRTTVIIPLSATCREIIIQMETLPDATLSATVAGTSEGVNVARLAVSNIVNQNGRWWCCYMAAFFPFPFALSIIPATASTMSTATLNSYLISHNVLTVEKLFDGVRIESTQGNGHFLAGSRIWVYGR